MKSRWFAWMLLLLSGWSGAQTLSTPEQVVRYFIADYKTWNDRAQHRSEGPDKQGAMQTSAQEYRQLIAKYCRPGLVSQPIAFGTDSAHSPHHEAIVSVSTHGSKSVVRTRHKQRLGGPEGIESVANYEYHLSHDGKRWYLHSLLYLDKDGQYESL